MKKPTRLERSFKRTIATVLITTLKTQLWMAYSLAMAYISYWHDPDIERAILVYFGMQFLTFGLIFNYWCNFIGPLYAGTRKMDSFTNYLCTLFMPVVLLATFPKARKRLIRCYNIGQQWTTVNAERRFKKQLNLKTKIEKARLERLLKSARANKKEKYMMMFCSTSRAIGQYIHEIENHFHHHVDDENLAELFDRYQFGVPYHIQQIETKYNQKMAPQNYGKELPDISPKQSTLEGKLLYLAVLIRAEKDNHYDKLDFKRSDFKTGRYIYTSDRSAINLAHWNKYLPAINAYLGGEWVVEPLDGTSLVLYQLAELPPLIPFKKEFLKRDKIFYGFNVRTAERYYTSLEVMPHTLVVGKSGSGKSVFLNQIIASLIYNIDHFEKIYLIDLKGGVELSKYNGLHSKLHLVDHYDDLLGVFQQIFAQMEDRLKQMRQNGLTHFDGPHLCIICDEFAQIAQYTAITKEEKENKLQLQSYLNRISMLGRAAKVTLFIQLQKATIQNIDSSFRSNMATKICFKVHSNSDAATVFGNTEDLPAISSIGGFKNLDKGRYIISDDISGEDSYMQATLLDDSISLARLLQTADDTRVVSEAQADERESEAERASSSEGERVSEEDL